MKTFWRRSTLSLIATTCIASTLLTGCSTQENIPALDVGYVSTQSLQQASEAAQLSAMRKEAIQTTAAQLGTQGGFSLACKTY